MWSVVALAGAWAAFQAGRFLLTSPEMALIHPDQISVARNHFVSPAGVREVFAADRGKSVLRIPLDQRRKELEAIPWIEEAAVRRALPNRIEIEITERTPVAFLREANDMALVDGHGVILDRPLEGDFHFPVVTGIGPAMAQEDRERRMQLFSGFLQQIESVRPGAGKLVSEVDLSDERDVRATLSGMQSGGAGLAGSASASQADAPVLVHFGDADFAAKYQALLANIGEYRARAGRLDSLDLRFNGQVVANPDPAATRQAHAAKRVAAHARPAKAKPVAAHASNSLLKNARQRKGGVSTPP
jgi:cell division protein FtsQ